MATRQVKMVMRQVESVAYLC